MCNLHTCKYFLSAIAGIYSLLISHCTLSAPSPDIPLGSFTIEMSGSFWHKTGTGTDKQEEHGKALVKIIKLATVEGYPDRHALAGKGAVGWYESVNSPNCNYSASANVDIVIGGTVYPAPVCRMDLEFYWLETRANPLGTCHGYPLNPFKLSAHDFKLQDIDLPIRDGQKIVFYLLQGPKQTIIFRDVKLDYVGLGCVPKP